MASRKAALVTGAATGIGSAAVLALARAGYDVAVNYSSSENAARDTAAAAEKLGARTIILKCDVSDEPGVRKMVSSIKEKFGARRADQQRRHDRQLEAEGPGVAVARG